MWQQALMLQNIRSGAQSVGVHTPMRSKKLSLWYILWSLLFTSISAIAAATPTIEKIRILSCPNPPCDEYCFSTHSLYPLSDSICFLPFSESLHLKQPRILEVVDSVSCQWTKKASADGVDRISCANTTGHSANHCCEASKHVTMRLHFSLFSQSHFLLTLNGLQDAGGDKHKGPRLRQKCWTYGVIFSYRAFDTWIQVVGRFVEKNDNELTNLKFWCFEQVLLWTTTSSPKWQL